MATEDYYWKHGVGKPYRKVKNLAKRGADVQTICSEIIRGLRNDIKNGRGLAELISHAAGAGVLATEEAALPLIARPEEIRSRVRLLRRGSDPFSDAAATVLQRNWNRIENGQGSQMTRKQLVCDFLGSRVASVCLSRIERFFPPNEKVQKTKDISQSLRRALQTEHADIGASLLKDPSGSKVRVRFPRPKVPMEALIHAPIETLEARP